MDSKSDKSKTRGGSKVRFSSATIASWIITAVVSVIIFLGMIFHEAFFSWLNSWPDFLVWLKPVLGVSLAISFVGFFFVAIMLTYLELRKKWAKNKFRAEGVAFMLALLPSLGFKIAIFFMDAAFAGEELLSGVAGVILKALYATIGGISFEGLPDVEGLRELQLIPFYGTSIVAGLVVIAAISSTFAYEAYSFVLIRIRYGFGKGELRYDTYVFTSLNEETLCMACSIDEYYKNKGDEAVIIFAGPALEPFDRHDEKCAEVMGNGFLYWSYYENKETSIAAALGLKKKFNIGTDKLFYVFAFDTNEHEVPEEEKNADAIFDDGRARRANPDKLYVHYILLGKGENDYQAYQVMRSKDLSDESSSLSLWTEAKSIAAQVSSYLKNADILDAAIPKKDVTRVRSIGFGETARAITKELYIQSTRVSYEDYGAGKFVEAKFEADVFDSKSMEIAGLFKKENPYALVHKKGEPAPEDINDLNCPIYCFNEKNYTHIDVVSGNDNTDFDYGVVATGSDRENINIANSIISDRLGKPEKPKLILFITVYDKRNNIYLAAPQQLLSAIDTNPKMVEERQRARKNFDKDVEQIYRSARFSDKEEAAIYRKNIYYYAPNLIAVIVGNREDTFQFPLIHYQRRSANFDGIYKSISDKISSYQSETQHETAKAWTAGLTSIRSFLRFREEPEIQGLESAKKMLNSVLEAYRFKPESSEADSIRAWNELPLWDRQSNIELGSYARTYYKYVLKDYRDGLEYMLAVFEGASDNKATTQNDLFRLTALLIYNEHARWNRVHIAAGWKHGDRDKPHRVHNSLVPISELGVRTEVPWTYMYDLANCLHAIHTYSSIDYEADRESQSKNLQNPDKNSEFKKGMNA